MRKSRGGDSVQELDRGPETDGNSGPGPALPPPIQSRRPHGPTPLIPSLGHAPAAPAAALGHEPLRGSRAEQLPEPRPRRGWGPRWPGRGRGAGGGGGGGGRRRRGEMRVVGGWACIFQRLSTFLFVSLCPFISSSQPQLLPCPLLVSACLPAAGSPGVSVVLCGSVIQDLPAGTCPVSARSVWLALLRVSGPLHLCPLVLVSGHFV